MQSGDTDLWAIATALLFASGTTFAAGRLLGERLNPATVRGTLTGAIVLLLAFGLFGTDRLFWARLFPLSGIVAWGNALLPGVAFVAGLLLSPALREIPPARRRIICAVLLLCGAAQAVRPFLGDISQTNDVPVSAWQSGVCPQTTESTCSAASAATLLRANGVVATETEIAKLSLTRSEGTLMLGTYRALRVKTANTDKVVRVLSGAKVAALREATRTAPVLISVGIDHWQRGRIDPRYESLWGWTPGKRHAVVLFGFLPNGKLDIGDPSVGREVWDAKALAVLWHGDALQIIPR